MSVAYKAQEAVSAKSYAKEAAELYLELSGPAWVEVPAAPVWSMADNIWTAMADEIWPEMGMFRKANWGLSSLIAGEMYVLGNRYCLSRR